MNVVHVINSLGYGGAERQLSILSAEMVNNGVHQRIVPLVSTESGVLIDQRVPVSVPKHGTVGVLRAVAAIVRHCRQQPGSLIVAWMYHSWIASLVALPFCPKGTRLVLYCRHGDMESLSLPTRTIAHLAFVLARLFTIGVVFNSDTARSAHERYFAGLEVWVVPNAVVASDCLASNSRGRSGTFGFLGRNHRDKGADRLLGLVRRIQQAIPDSKFLFVGPGMLELQLEFEGQAAAAEIDMGAVKFSGPVQNTELVFRAIDVLLLPSRTEGFPNVVVESMAEGVIPACMAVGDVPAILEGIVPVSASIDELARNAIALFRLEDCARSALLEKLRISAVERYDPAVVAKRHLEVWRIVLEERAYA